MSIADRNPPSSTTSTCPRNLFTGCSREVVGFVHTSTTSTLRHDVDVGGVVEFSSTLSSLSLTGFVDMRMSLTFFRRLMTLSLYSSAQIPALAPTRILPVVSSPRERRYVPRPRGDSFCSYGITLSSSAAISLMGSFPCGALGPRRWSTSQRPIS